MKRQIIISIFYCSALLFFVSAKAWGAHGLSIDGLPKYQAGFSSFAYTSDQAQKGGAITLHSIGSFDKMNPFTLKGASPDGLERYVFESLAVPSLDEPFSYYGLLAEDIEIAEDQKSVIFTINSNATFSDGTPVLAEDVKYTIDTLKSDKVHPFYRYYYADIERTEILDVRVIQVHFKKLNRELPLIACQIKVMSKKFYEEHGFNHPADITPIGSGPYYISSVVQGKNIVYERNKSYWAHAHPTRKNMYNFDQITIKYYKDPTVAVEAFKAGEYDYMLVNIAKQWERDLSGESVNRKGIVKKKFPHRNNAGMQGFVMNTRKRLFADTQVRQALSLAFDFEWANRSLFFNQYKRSTSYFSNSDLAARGLPTDKELELLLPFKDQLPEAVFSIEPGKDLLGPKKNTRARLRTAMELLQKGGWKLKNGILVDQNGNQFTFEILLINPSFERVMAAYVDNLKKLGIKATYRTIDPAVYTERINNFDFDMCVYVYGQSQSPGNEQRDFWHSEAADKPGSRNLAGIKDPVIDALIDKIIYATSREDLLTATWALDRVLWFGYYLVPNWYLDGHRIAFYDNFSYPDILPTYYDHNSFLMTWWSRENN
ncbi:MAG: ABC transporter substrate-binding protein [Desulfobulbaceae bacterium]|nr:MAG: ABC transporter substrate-binding protein [Desulfobulbaceae bacterium]